MALVQTLEIDPRITSTPKTWSYLWEDNGPCGVLFSALHTSRSGSGMLWLFLNRFIIIVLMEDWRAETIFRSAVPVGEVAPETTSTTTTTRA